MPNQDDQFQQALPPEPFTQADVLRLGEYNAGLSQVQKQVDDGVLTQDEGISMTTGILKMRLPLLERQKQAAQYANSQKVQQLQEVSALTEGMQQSGAVFRANGLRDRISVYTDPITGRDAHFYESEPNKFVQVKWDEPGAESAAVKGNGLSAVAPKEEPRMDVSPGEGRDFNSIPAAALEPAQVRGGEGPTSAVARPGPTTTTPFAGGGKGEGSTVSPGEAMPAPPKPGTPQDMAKSVLTRFDELYFKPTGEQQPTRDDYEKAATQAIAEAAPGASKDMTGWFRQWIDYNTNRRQAALNQMPRAYMPFGDEIPKRLPPEFPVLEAPAQAQAGPELPSGALVPDAALIAAARRRAWEMFPWKGPEPGTIRSPQEGASWRIRMHEHQRTVNDAMQNIIGREMQQRGYAANQGLRVEERMRQEAEREHLTEMRQQKTDYGKRYQSRLDSLVDAMHKDAASRNLTVKTADLVNEAKDRMRATGWVEPGQQTQPGAQPDVKAVSDLLGKAEAAVGKPEAAAYFEALQTVYGKSDKMPPELRKRAIALQARLMQASGEVKPTVDVKQKETKGQPPLPTGPSPENAPADVNLMFKRMEQAQPGLLGYLWEYFGGK